MIIKGDLVRIFIPAEACRTIAINNTLAKKYNNVVGVVSKVRTFYRADDPGQKAGTYYELEDITSDAGVPYGFDSSWVSKVEEA